MGSSTQAPAGFSGIHCRTFQEINVFSKWYRDSSRLGLTEADSKTNRDAGDATGYASPTSARMNTMISSGGGTRLNACSLPPTSFESKSGDRIQTRGGIGAHQRGDEGHRGKHSRD
jgi:hypothetical protein